MDEFDEDGLEDIHLYEPGGLCPIHLGDRLDNATYTIVYKIGHGACSTVWLARDNLFGQDPKAHPYRHVALKFARADKVGSAREIEILEHLQQSHSQKSLLVSGDESGPERDSRPVGDAPNHPGIVRLIRSFTVQSSNGVHDVLVLPVLREANEYTHAFRQHCGFLDKLSSRYSSLFRQLIDAVAFVHDSGIVHGDIRPDNMGYLCEDMTENDLVSFPRQQLHPTTLWRYPDEPASSVTAFDAHFIEYQESQEPEFFKPLDPDFDKHLPNYLVNSDEWRYMTDHELFTRHRKNPRFALIDFGHGFFKNSPLSERPHIGTPSRYRPPEYYYPTHRLKDADEVIKHKPKDWRYHSDYQDSLGDECEKMDVWSCAATLCNMLVIPTPISSNIHTGFLRADPCIPDEWMRMETIRFALGKIDGSLEDASEGYWKGLLERGTDFAFEVAERTKQLGHEVPAHVDVKGFPAFIDIIRYSMRLDPRVRPSAADAAKRLSTSSNWPGEVT